MKEVSIPQSELMVAGICCGCCDFGTRTDRDGSFRVMDTYVEAGGNFYDTAHVYAAWVPGHAGASERTLGAFLADRGIRDQAIVATKGGHPTMGDPYPRPDHFLAADLMTADITESLERLQTDWIDLYYLHRDDGHTPVDEVMSALNAEVDKGRIRALGASNWSVERIVEANKWAAANGKKGFSVIQNQWSLAIPVWKITEDPTVRYITPNDANRLGGLDVLVAPYSSTANGFFATNGAALGAFDTDDNRARLQRANGMAAEKGCTPNQIALAYLLNQPLPVVPIIGTIRPEHLLDAVGALEVDLGPEDLAYLRG